jgi:hypothetical protein
MDVPDDVVPDFVALSLMQVCVDHQRNNSLRIHSVWDVQLGVDVEQAMGLCWTWSDSLLKVLWVQEVVAATMLPQCQHHHPHQWDRKCQSPCSPHPS